MRRIITGTLIGLCAASTLFGAVDLSNQRQLQSYAVGQSFGENIRFQGLDVDQVAFLQGLTDSLENHSQLSSDQMKTAITEFQKIQYEKQRLAKESQGKENAQKGQAFLNENKKQKGVKTTASGLQYKVIKEGSKTGKSPKATDEVTVNYEGTLLDGSIFDSSFERGEPATFPLDGVIKGWTEGLQLMKEGAEYMFYIPAELAYGTRGAGPKIGPNSTLIFRVVLIKVKS